MLCQEDILEEMSDSEREEFLQELLSPEVSKSSNCQSVFVSENFLPEFGPQESPKKE